MQINPNDPKNLVICNTLQYHILLNIFLVSVFSISVSKEILTHLSRMLQKCAFVSLSYHNKDWQAGPADPSFGKAKVDVALHANPLFGIQ